MIKKRLYTSAYFLIQYNQEYGHSLGVRIKYFGMAGLFGGAYGYSYFLNNLRLKGASNDQFD